MGGTFSTTAPPNYINQWYIKKNKNKEAFSELSQTNILMGTINLTPKGSDCPKSGHNDIENEYFDSLANMYDLSHNPQSEIMIAQLNNIKRYDAFIPTALHIEDNRQFVIRAIVGCHEVFMSSSNVKNIGNRNKQLAKISEYLYENEWSGKNKYQTQLEKLKEWYIDPRKKVKQTVQRMKAQVFA